MHTNAAGGLSVQAQRIEAWDEAAALLGSLDSLRVALTIFDAAGRLLYANAHLNYLLRSLPPHPSLIGCSYHDIIAFEIEGGEIARSALAKGNDAFIARRLAQLQDGAYAPLDVPLADHRVIEIKARKAAGGRTVLLWSDVTAARAQLARLEEAVALSAEAFAFFDANDRLIMGNLLYAQICGHSDVDALIGKTFGEIVTSVAHSGRILFDESPETWLERRLKGHTQPAGAITLKTSSGECYIVRDRATPDGGRALAFTDVTDRVRAEAALAEQQEALAATQAAAVKFRERLHQGQAQARTLGMLAALGAAGMLERLLDARQVFRRHTGAVIGHGQAHGVVARFHDQGHGVAGEGDGIVHQRMQHGAEHGFIGLGQQPDRAARGVDGDTAGFGAGQQRIARQPQDAAGIHRRLAQIVAAGRDLGQVHDLADHLEQVGAALMHQARILTNLVG